MKNLIALSLLLNFALLSACKSTPVIEDKTLASIDTPFNNSQATRKTSSIKKQNEENIKEAYYQYIRNAKKNDVSRKNALNRLAQLELRFTQKLIAQNSDDPQQTQQYRQGLVKTARLLETTLRDYPDAKDNDQNLYHLARTYDQLDEYDKSDAALNMLIKKFPRSDYFVEAQFRIAERAFARGDYIQAEDAYTEVILSPVGDRFYDKSLFKRGWTRYKQQLGEEALDDYIQVAQQFTKTDASKQTVADQSVLNETMRAIALSSFLLEAESGFHDYLSNHPEFELVYESYLAAAELYVKQERFSDANTMLKQFIRFYPDAPERPMAFIKVIEVWKKGGFKSKVIEDVTTFYNAFNPGALYWKQPNRIMTNEIGEALRDNIVLVAKAYHENYQNSKKIDDFNQAQVWYERYLTHFPSFANQNNLYSTYGNLLTLANKYESALENFEKAAFNDDLILDKTAAYSAISISNTLYDNAKNASIKQTWLEKYLRYSQSFISLYPNDEKSSALALRSAQLSFNNKQYQKALTFSQVQHNLSVDQLYEMKTIRAKAFYQIQEYANAEQLFIELLAQPKLSKKQRSQFSENIAISIYKQGETSNDKIAAYGHFSRISKIVPNTDIAATGLFDAISIAVNQKQWQQSIADIERFKKLYPKNKNIATVNKTLTVAYLNSNQQGKAAQAFEQLALSDSDKQVKMAALWKAGELYESKKQFSEAIRAYRDLANNFSAPYDQNMEAMYKLVELYNRTGEKQKRFFWQNKIQRKDANTSDKLKSERTQFIAATTVLDLAEQKNKEFQQVKLIEPITRNVKKKKASMQQAIQLYGRASSFGIADITTQSTHSIGDIYKHFSLALLDSQRPNNLNDDELEQYEILLEDQAFPFEEKAIELYEVNVSRVKEGNYNAWIEKSFSELKALFPVRYGRTGKIGLYDE